MFSSLCIRAPGLCCYRKVVKSYLTLAELGSILRHLSMSQGTYSTCSALTKCAVTNSKTIPIEHHFNLPWLIAQLLCIFPFFSVAYKLREPRTFDLKLLKTGSPNLLVVPKGTICIIRPSVIDPPPVIQCIPLCVCSMHQKCFQTFFSVITCYSFLSSFCFVSLLVSCH